MTDRLEEVCARVLGLRAGELDADASPLTVTAWNSLKHIELIVAVETTYGVRFAQPEIVALRSMRDIRALLRRKGVEAP